MHPNSDLRQAFETLENFQKNIGNIEDEAVKAYCLEAESKLATVFCEIAFFVQYKLKTVHQIEVQKTRFQKATFKHFHFLLDKVHLDPEVDTIERPHFIENRSVIFYTKRNLLKVRLNLAPLVIDINAFNVEDINAKPSLYYFAFQDVTVDTYYFEEINNPKGRLLEIDNETFPETKKLLDKMVVDFK